MMLGVLLIDLILYFLIVIKCFQIQDKTPYFFNYLIISCFLNIFYEILLISQIYYPILPAFHYQVKEYTLLFQFLYFLMYISKYNFFYNKSFEKAFTCLIHVFILIFCLIVVCAIYPGISPAAAFFNLFSNWTAIIFFIILYTLYIIPTMFQKKFNKKFKQIILFFLINSILINIQVIFSINIPVFYLLTAISCIIFNYFFYQFISKYNGRYLND